MDSTYKRGSTGKASASDDLRCHRKPRSAPTSATHKRAGHLLLRVGPARASLFNMLQYCELLARLSSPSPASADLNVIVALAI